MQAWARPTVAPLPAEVGGTPVQVYDTVAQRLVPAGPSTGSARLYVCGITPYDATHLGHANTYVAFDLLNRIWRDAGLDVTYVQNVTDVDDPLLERAAQTGADWEQLAQSQVQLFCEDMAALRVLPPDELPGAVESMDLIVDLVNRLADRGSVYALDDAQHPDLYVAQDSDPYFGFLSRLDEHTALELFAERGGDPDRPGKKSPLDSLAWRLARAGEPNWPAPMGRGRPGWHVECTAIALDLLGTNFDVQGGGSDLIFPHHEMCASAGRLATDEPFAQLYVHSGMVGLDGEKMSKSRGNLVLVSALRKADDPMAIRLALLDHHYRADWMWTAPQLDTAARRLERWRQAVRLPAGPPADRVVAEVRASLRSDLDAPGALAAVDAWAAAAAAGGEDSAAPATVAAVCDALLGVSLTPAGSAAAALPLSA